MAMVNDIKLSSRLRLGKARLLAQGEYDGVARRHPKFDTALKTQDGHVLTGHIRLQGLVNRGNIEFQMGHATGQVDMPQPGRPPGLGVSAAQR